MTPGWLPWPAATSWARFRSRCWSAAREGFDPRQAGDQNPGFWNMKDQLGWAWRPPGAGRGHAEGHRGRLLGLMLAHGVLVLGAGARDPGRPGARWGGPGVRGRRGGHDRARLARLRPAARRPERAYFRRRIRSHLPARLRPGRRTLRRVALLTRSFAIGARAGVFAVPFLQLIFTPALEVAATGALMSLIGVRFAMAAVAARRRKSRLRPEARPHRPTAPDARTEPGAPDNGAPARTAPAE